MKIYRKIFLILFLIFPSLSFAITLDKTDYLEGEPIIGSGDGGPVVIYNNTPADPNNYIFTIDYPIFNVPSYSQDWIVNQYNDNNPDALYMALGLGNYSIIELTDTGTNCFVNGDTYAECKASPEFVNEFVFNVVTNPEGSGGDPGSTVGPVLDPELKPTKRPKFFNYLSDITILNPKVNSVFSSQMTIDYKVTDRNDLGSDEEKGFYGLASKPVSLFYSDKISEWYDILTQPADKNIIAKDLPAKGQYSWSVKDLIPGILYRIIVDAFDNSNNISENVSDFFTVDFTPPVFSIKTDPIAVRGGDVNISIDASEKLSLTPDVFVTQKDAQPIKVKMTGSGNHFDGVYSVISGFDGPAKISVSGTDESGNVGSTTISGGTLNVGVNPPPKPVLYASSTRFVVNKETFSLSGTIRNDTEAVLYVNGVEISSTTPNTKGEFSFSNIHLDKVKNKGLNYIGIVSRDNFGSVSETTTLEVKYNVAPVVEIVSPLNKELLKDQTTIKVKATDENQDILYYTYQVISSDIYNSDPQSKKWITINDNSTSNNFNWITSEVEDGNYMIRVIVSDGNAQVTSSPIQVTLNNVLPFFRFEDGRKTTTKSSNVTIVGRALVSDKIIPAPYIESVAYSMDGGDTWTPVQISSAQSIEQKFSVTFTDLPEGIYPIVWWTKDSRKIIGKTVHTIVVDKTAPKAPEIVIPRTVNGSVLITDSDDTNLLKSGEQINISGISEPLSIVSLVGLGNTLTTKTLPTGEFVFSDVTVEKKGMQIIKLLSKDEAGNISAPTSISLIYNNPPQITFINPKPFRGLSGKSVLSWNIIDVDGDTIKNVDISYRTIGGTFKTLVSNTSAKGTYTWDTSNLPESNEYELQITASDSITPVSAVTSFFIDRTPPVLLSFLIKKEMIDKKVNFTGEGTASDGVSGVEYVEYSIKSDTDKNRGDWFKATIVKGYLQKQASFIIKYPNDLPDNSYTIYARAVDAAGNISNELNQSIYIDRTPPNVGSFFIIKNDFKIIPDQEGNISFYENSPFTFAVSIEKDTKTATLTIDNKNINLNKNLSSGLWEATTTIETSVPQDILITAEDDSGNVTNIKKIGVLTGAKNGNVMFTNSKSVNEFVSGVNIRIHKLNDITGQYEKYIPTIGGVSAEITTDENGEYNLVLPAGKYHISAVKSGYKVIQTDVDAPGVEIVNYSFTTKKLSVIQKVINDILYSWFY